MSQTVLAIQTLGFITGTVLFSLLWFLTHKAENPPEEKRARVLAAAMGLVWNLGSLVEYVARLGGDEIDALVVRLARAFAYSGTAFLATAFFMLMALPQGEASRLRKWRWTVPISVLIGAGLTLGFCVTALLRDWYQPFKFVMLLSAYNLALHLIVGKVLFRQGKPSGYRLALLLAASVLAVLLFLQIHFPLNASLEVALTVISQQSSIPMALIALAWLSQFRFADLFVKQSFLILAAVLSALLFQWLVVAPLVRLVSSVAVHREAAAWVVGTLLWAALLLMFPLCRKKLLQAADTWIFKRPDYREILQDFRQASEVINDEKELFTLAERRVSEALRGAETKIVPAELATDLAFQIQNQAGESYALTLATGSKSLLSDEITLLTALTELIGRRLEAIHFERERQAQLLREARLQQLLSEAELKALRAQINPHFLFNTLNTIAALISEAPDKAEQLTERLSDVFRYVLTRANSKWISLSEEFEFLRTYLEIEQARFGPRLRVEMELAPAIASAQIPTLLLQPLVENAIKHGLASKPEGGTLRVQATDQGERLQLLVQDDGGGWRVGSANGMGIGLQNVTERLQMLYAERAQINIQSEIGQGTRITILLPKDETQNAAHRRRSIREIAAQETARRAS